MPGYLSRQFSRVMVPLESVPFIRARRARSLAHANLAFEALALELYQNIRDRGLRSLLIAGAFPGDGRTSIAAHLGGALTNLGLGVTLVESSPTSTDLLSLATAGSPISGQPLSQLKEPVIVGPGLRVIGSGALPSDYPGRPIMAALLAEFIQGSDIVILDSPAATLSAAPYVIGCEVNGVLYVVRRRQQDVVAQRSVIARFQRLGAHIIGALFNDKDLS